MADKSLRMYAETSEERYIVPLPLGDPAGLGPGVAAVHQCSDHGFKYGNINPTIHFTPIIPPPDVAYSAPTAISGWYIAWAKDMIEIFRMFIVLLDNMGEMQKFCTDSGDLGPWKTDKKPEAPPRVYAYDPTIMKLVEKLEAEITRLRRVVTELGGDTAVAVVPGGSQSSE